MIRLDQRTRLLAILLSATAGYVDAIGFVHLGGFFVSFMSGNTTRLGVGLAADASDAGIAAMLIALFVGGVVAGTLIGRGFHLHRRTAVLALVSALLFAAAGLGLAGWHWSAVVAMAMAMGAENAVFESDGEVQVGLTYMTGTLVKLGQRLTAALTGGDRWAWTPYFLLWSGLALGAVAGAAIYPHWGLPALGIAGAATALLAVAAATIDSLRA